MRATISSVTLLLTASALFATSLHAQETQEQRYITPSEYPENVYFGDPHVHTSLSMDAAAWGTRLGPEAAYRFALGEEVTSFKGWKAKLTRPLDWLAVADHTDGYGFYTRLQDGDPWIVDEPLGKRWYDLLQQGDLRTVTDELIKGFSQGGMPWDVASPEMLGPGWEQTIKTAEDERHRDRLHVPGQRRHQITRQVGAMLELMHDGFPHPHRRVLDVGAQDVGGDLPFLFWYRAVAEQGCRTHGHVRPSRRRPVCHQTIDIGCS